MFFSIIIPVYNTAPYLRECLDSIRNQTFTDWECICVDDGSTDDSWAILQEYAAKDPRFQIFHQENQGVSAARNYALDHIRGDYFTFVDSDDMVCCDMLLVWHQFLLSTHADILMEAEAPLRAEKTKKIDEFLSRKKENVTSFCLSSSEALKYCHTIHPCPGITFKKAYLTKKLGDARFDTQMAMAEDIDYFLNVFSKDNLCWCIINTNSYFYRIRYESAIFLLTPQKRLNTLIVLAKNLEMLSNMGLEQADCRIFWENKRGDLTWWVRGAEDCWNHLSATERKEFMNCVQKAHRILGYYPFDFIMRVRLQFFKGHCEWIPRLMEYLYCGTIKYWKKIFPVSHKKC